MAQGGWLVMSTPANLTQVVCIFLVTFLISLGGLHHAIAGNTVGGTGFVALLNDAHVRRTRTLEGEEKGEIQELVVKKS